MLHAGHAARCARRIRISASRAGRDWRPGNKIAKEYGIHQIPTMWLLDKKGVLRDLGAVEGLQEKINRLLNEN